MISVSFIRQIALAFLAVAGVASPAIAEPCELHVWAEGNKTGPAVDPRKLTPAERSEPKNVLDAGQRLFEIDPKYLVASLQLPIDTRVVVHTENQLVGRAAEQSSSRLSRSSAPCYIDWTFRADSMFGPPPYKNYSAFFTEDHGQLFYYSILKAYDVDPQPYFFVKGVHRGHLPVLGRPQGTKIVIYDTQSGTQQLVDHAAEKIKDKLKGRNLLKRS